MSCAEGDTGFIYDGLLETEVTEVQRGEMPADQDQDHDERRQSRSWPSTSPSCPTTASAWRGSSSSSTTTSACIPKAILDYPNVDADLKKAVESVARGHASPRAFYVDKVAEGVATIAAAFWPKPVIVRLSDFKSNEYRKLIGGSRYEPEEENPMLGFRGAARYVSGEFQRSLRDGVRGAAAGAQRDGPDQRAGDGALRAHAGPGRHASRSCWPQHGLKRGEDDLKVIMMCEVPSNAILADEFLEYFDGFSIGSNDLTQLTLGLDRDSGLELLAADFDERDPAVKALLAAAIQACKAQGKYVRHLRPGPQRPPGLRASGWPSRASTRSP